MSEIDIGENSLSSKPRPLVVPASHIILERNGETLVLRRTNTSYMSGWYDLPGGHIEPGETALEAAIRECAEECTIEVSMVDIGFVGVIYRLDSTTGLARVEFFFRAESWRGLPTIGEPSRFDDLKWVSIKEPPESLIPYIANAIKDSGAGTPWYRDFDISAGTFEHQKLFSK